MINRNKCSVDNVDNSLVEQIEGFLESRGKYRKIIQAGIARWVKDFQDGRIKIETVEDLHKLIKMDIELQKEELFLLRRKEQQQRR